MPSRPSRGRGPGARIKRADAVLLLDVTRRLAACQGLAEQLHALVGVTKEAMGAERGTVFLHDPARKELFSFVTRGGREHEIRIPEGAGVAGHCFRTGEGCTVADAYEDERFERTVDQMTGFRTRQMVCAPLRTVRGEVLGVAQCLNKSEGEFGPADLALLESMGMQAAVVLQSSLIVLESERLRRQESEFLQLVGDVSTELQLGPLLRKIMDAVTKMLDADRSTLFLHDAEEELLYTVISQGLGETRLQLPQDQGLAGAVFTSGRSVNIPHAYADLRFDPSFDKQTGYFTRSMLCVPVRNKDGRVIGVTQVLNKRGGAFTQEDEERLVAFTAQISIGLENAKLFDDVQRMKDYSESVLESMSNGVLTFDAKGLTATCNRAGAEILGLRPEEALGMPVEELMGEGDAWLAERLRRVGSSREPEHVLDAELDRPSGKRSVHATLLPLDSAPGSELGEMLLLEDVTGEKRVKATMARYMDPGLADQLVAAGDEVLGGQTREATLLFSDVRKFTNLTEALGAQGTVQLLNEYFTLMVDCIDREGGLLDKFIGDAIMAIFGTPFPHEDDADRAVRAAIRMVEELEAYNASRADQGLGPVDMGIGLNTGEVVAGNIGSPKRMDYTVIGDAVNLAARLESATKNYGARLLISEFTADALRTTYRLREVDRIVVKGKTQPVRVHEVLDYHTKASFPELARVLPLFREGYEAYAEGRFEEALRPFRAAAELAPQDGATLLYLERCAQLLADPPEDWDGVWVYTTK